MLLKYSQYQKRSRLLTNGPQRATGGMKMLNGKGKGYRKGVKCAASKRVHPRSIASKKEEISSMTVDPCDNSNDSGLGIDHNEFSTNHRSLYIDQECCWNEGSNKKRRYDIIKHESDNANDNFTFLPKVTQRQSVTELPLCLIGKTGSVVARSVGKTTATQGLSRNGKVQLEIVSQPEMQHRARYQTEGSRGAVKDRTGNSFPIVRLTGYKKPATLEVYIGTDQGRVAPHMFYQACRVAGKNSTPCSEKKVDGTILIEIEMDPTKDMTVTCDCVGILKERNVDVEHRFPEESSGRSKKKSTRCRMVFRTSIINDEGTPETLQVTSQPIICTQPPGTPEICKKSLTSCPASGGLELFLLGKNFLKDTRVLFSHGDPGTDMYWEAYVQPDKEFLQQSHLVCTIPPFRDEGIREMVAVRLSVMSSGRSSEPHSFFYTPLNALTMEPTTVNRAPAQNIIGSPIFPSQNVLLGVQWHVPMQPAPSFIQEETPKIEEKAESEMMPPPATVPPVRRSDVKREAESPTSCLPPAFQEFVSTDEAPLPSISVENYLSRIESPPRALPPGKAADLLPSLPLVGQLELPTQQSLTSSGQVLIAPKLSGLLGETSEPLLAGAELIFPTAEGVPAAVTPTILENPGQDFVTVQNNPIQDTTGFRVGGEVVAGGVVFSPERLATPAQHASPLSLASTSPLSLTSSSSLSLASPSPLSLASSVAPQVSLSPGQAFPVLLPESALQAFSPTKEVKPVDLISNLPKDISPIPELPKDQQPIPQKKCEEGIPLPQELTQMSEHDLLSYINPSCFDQGNPSTFPQFYI